MVTELESLFPRLQPGKYQITSPPDARYNCIAWALGDTAQWWWPELDPENGRWPEGVPTDVTVPAFLAALATLGYAPTDREDGEAGWEMIALFADAGGAPTHAARQLPNGRWTSKIGKLEDIEHELHDLEGKEYGTVVQIVKRALNATGNSTQPQQEAEEHP
jgi:hypothetical protein